MSGVDDKTIVCTAVSEPGEVPPHLLFTPPCACPNCAPERQYPDRSTAARWLRVPGRDHRHRVVAVTLGPRGQAALG